MLKATTITKKFGPLTVLKGVDISIEKGEMVSIVGSSGAGKSTLLHILGTLDSPDSGNITIDGQLLSSLTSSQLAAFRNKHIGFIFQFHHLLPEFDALENVCIPGWIANKPREEVKKRALELLEILGLANRIHHKPNELSGGEQQRVAVARALINDPLIVFADEPTGNLDAHTGQQIIELFARLNQDGLTMLLVTHELTEDTRRALIDGTIDIIINQDAGHEVRSAIRSNAPYVLRDAAIEGAGVALLPDWIAAPDIAAGRLRHVLRAWQTAPVVVSAVHRKEARGAPRIKAFLDHLAAVYAAEERG